MLTLFELGFIKSVLTSSLYKEELHIEAYENSNGYVSKEDIEELKINAQRKRDLIKKLDKMAGVV